MRYVRQEAETRPRDRPRRHVPFPPLANPTPPVRRQHATAPGVIVRPIVESGPHAGEEEAPVKTPVMEVIVMESGEVREGMAAECRPRDHVWPHHMGICILRAKLAFLQFGVLLGVTKSPTPPGEDRPRWRDGPLTSGQTAQAERGGDHRRRCRSMLGRLSRSGEKPMAPVISESAPCDAKSRSGFERQTARTSSHSLR